MGAAASPLSFASAGLSGFGKIFSGYTQADQQIQSGTQQSQMDAFQAQQLANAADYSYTQASQTDTIMRQQLQKMLGGMMATRASANTAPESPTGAAILSATQGQGDQQRNIQVGNLAAQAAQQQADSGFYTSAAQQTLQDAYANAGNSILGGFLGAGGSVLSGMSGLKFG